MAFGQRSEIGPQSAPIIPNSWSSHVVADRVEAAYRRGDLFERRIRLMDDWAAYCASMPKVAAQNVVPMRGAR
jgi:hypothetical protein